MFQLIDTHAHTYNKQFNNDQQETLERAKAAGIARILLPNVDQESLEPLRDLTFQYPDVFQAMMGLHPCSVKEDWKPVVDSIELFFKKESIQSIAIGEIGLDYYWDKTHVAEQKAALTYQCEWALKLNLPVALHTRESMDDALEIIDTFAKRGLRGVYHCFSGDKTQAEAALDMGFHLGIGGTLTYKNNPLAEMLAELDRERLMSQLLLETDSPYLAPVPYRGKRNESAYIPLVLHKLAEALQLPAEQIAAQTTKNACDLFTLSL